MSEKKWTPGPWEVGPANMVDSNAVTAIARCGCAFRSPQYSGTDFATPAHQEANARLISAAPDLYDALEECKRVLSDLQSTQLEGTRTRDAWEKARAALAKARGE
jgi:hypothetical protein